MESNRKPPENSGAEDSQLNEVTVTQSGKDDSLPILASQPSKPLGKLGEFFPTGSLGKGELAKAQEIQKREMDLKSHDPKELKKLHTPKWRQHQAAIFATAFLLIVTAGFLTWRLFTRGERRTGKAADDFGKAFDLT